MATFNNPRIFIPGIEQKNSKPSSSQEEKIAEGPNKLKKTQSKKCFKGSEEICRKWPQIKQ